jgi:putative ATP-binding cassette transporter
MRTTKRLNVASTFYAQFAIIFPFLVGAPRYFSGAITLGGLMQISSAFGQVQSSLSWFIDAFSALAEWKASVNRLSGFHAAVDAARNTESRIRIERNGADEITLNELMLELPSGLPLTQPLSAAVSPGQRILVSGPSGCGKSTMFRAIAGIWPYGDGSVDIPQDATLLFLPQRSYLPIGSLRAAVSYPLPPETYADADILQQFGACRLAHLAAFLDQEENWSQKLSPGEQQRLAFVRVLLIRPDVVFLDEASSAMDSDTEAALYALLTEELSDATIVSIAHRDSVARHHHLRWQFVAEQGPRQGDERTFRIIASTLPAPVQERASQASASRTQ